MKKSNKPNPNYKFYDEIRTNEEENFRFQLEKKKFKPLKKIKTNDQEQSHKEKTISLSKIDDNKNEIYIKSEISSSNESESNHSERDETNEDLKNIKTTADRLSKIAHNLFIKNVETKNISLIFDHFLGNHIEKCVRYSYFKSSGSFRISRYNVQLFNS